MQFFVPGRAGLIRGALISSATILAIFPFGQSSFAGDVPCDPDSPMVSIYDLGPNTYKTFEGGFYEGGSNTRPAAHEAAGVALANTIVPLNAAGNVDHDDGEVVLLAIGFSNLKQEWATGANGAPESQNHTFTAKATALQQDGLVNPKLVIVDGAIGGASADEWARLPSPSVSPWRVPLIQLERADLTRLQVQVAVVKTSLVAPTQCISEDGSDTGFAGVIAWDLAQTARNLKTAFPNVKLVYFISRSYGGYALTPRNPEPFAYEIGFSIKWVVNSQINSTNEYGDLQFGGPNPTAPWLSFGPYLWANGESPNGQGLSWSEFDFRPDDRTHPSATGVDKASGVFLDFFINDTTTRPWFLTAAGRCDADVDASGAVDVFDLFELLQAWGPCASPDFCEADITGNGEVNVLDLFEVLNSWGVCSLSRDN